MTHLKLCESTSYDRSKIVISTEGTDWSSRELSEKLFHTFHLQMEMTAGNYILAMTSVADTKEGFDRLEKALLEIDKQVKTCQDSKKIRTEIPKAEQARIPCWRDEVSEEEKEKYALKSAQAGFRLTSHTCIRRDVRSLFREKEFLPGRQSCSASTGIWDFLLKEQKRKTE